MLVPAQKKSPARPLNPDDASSAVLSIVLISPPGAGKSTQATRLAARFSIPWIATGEILRAAARDGTALGWEARGFVDRGAMVPDAVRRLGGRCIHPASGRTYHVVFQPPKVPNEDDVTGEALVQRADDSDEAVRRRLGLYHEQTQPVLSYCRRWTARDDGHARGCGETVGRATDHAAPLTRSGRR